MAIIQICLYDNQSLKYYNFHFIQNIDETSFYNICKYDYIFLVDFLLKNKNFDINKLIKESGEAMRWK